MDAHLPVHRGALARVDARAPAPGLDAEGERLPQPIAGAPGSTAPPGVFIHRLNYADALPEGKTITHRLKWESDPPNHEDGYLIGLDSLCETMGKAAESQE